VTKPEEKRMVDMGRRIALLDHIKMVAPSEEKKAFKRAVEIMSKAQIRMLFWVLRDYQTEVKKAIERVRI